MITEAKTSSHRWLWGLGAVALICVLAVLFALNPAHHAIYPVCYFHRLTGLQCPGCGGLRAVHHLLRGDIVTAFRFNQVVVLAVPVLAWLGVQRWRRGPAPQRPSWTRQMFWGWTILGVLIVFWIVRNLPLECFRLPAE
ncbi:MAG: hypothetical protein RLY20_1971 [Verrucomicrobiota bacterium]